MLQNYFRLQFKMGNRQLIEFGLPPIIAYVLAVITFVALSLYLWYKTPYAPYIYPFFALSGFTFLGNLGRNDFLKMCFSVRDYQKVRIAENGIVALPFVLFLGYQREWLVSLTLILVAVIMARWQSNNQWNYTLPTPFFHYPFEFLVGFRTTILLALFAYFLALKGISVGNFNLGLFSLFLLIGLSFSFYNQPESQLYVWIFDKRPAAFLWYKISIGFLYLTLLTIPLILLLLVYFPMHWLLIVGLHSIGFLYLSLVILAKYAAFPRAIHLPESLLIILSFVFPPLLLFTFPFFYKKAIQQLNPLLL
ncbi:MAG: ABC transporter permease [Bacteroidota bacterium]